MTEKDAERLGLLDRLEVGSLARYLSARGWNRVPSTNDRLTVYELPPGREGDDAVSVALPTDTAFVDARRRILEAVETVADVMGVTTRDVLLGATSANLDILRVRIEDRLSLEDAATRLSGIRNLLSDAACAEEQPRAYFPKALAIGREFVADCRFGHTFSGSIGFTVEAPLPLQGQRQLFADAGFQEPPFARRVLSRLARGLGIARRAAVEGDLDTMLDAWREGLNANMCSDLLQIVGDKTPAVEYSFAWSDEWAPGRELAALSRIRVESGAKTVLRSVVNHHTRGVAKPDSVVLGRVVELKSPDLIETQITVQNANGRRFRTQLSADEYRIACDAHRDERDVIVRGTIVREGRVTEIRNPQFEVVSKVDD